MRSLAGLVVAWGLAFALPAAAQTGELSEIDAARKALARASEALAAARKDDEKLAALGEAVRAQELALSSLRGALRAMRLQERRLLAEMSSQHARIGALLGALQSLSRAPRSALLVYPGGPVDAARAADLLAQITPELEARRIALAARIDRLEVLRTRQAAAGADARASLAALQELRATAASQIDRRRPKLPNRDALRAEAEAALARSEDLGQLSSVLGQGLGTVEARVPFELAQGSLAPPVLGAVIAGFGETDPWGRPGTGLSFSAPAWAEVTAPWDATVRFAGELIDYGQVIVLEPQTGWMIILAGLTNVSREVGEQVLMGERLGDLGGQLPSTEEFLREAGKETGQISEKKLYIELRHQGEPVDPTAWLAVEGERSSN